MNELTSQYTTYTEEFITNPVEDFRPWNAEEIQGFGDIPIINHILCHDQMNPGGSLSVLDEKKRLGGIVWETEQRKLWDGAFKIRVDYTTEDWINNQEVIQ